MTASSENGSDATRSAAGKRAPLRPGRQQPDEDEAVEGPCVQSGEPFVNEIAFLDAVEAMLP